MIVVELLKDTKTGNQWKLSCNEEKRTGDLTNIQSKLLVNEKHMNESNVVNNLHNGPICSSKIEKVSFEFRRLHNIGISAQNSKILFIIIVITLINLPIIL